MPAVIFCQEMANIGKICKHIQELVVADCPVTDAGIRNLCIRSDSHESCCQKLTNLNLENVRRVTEGGLLIALSHLTRLQNLQHQNLGKTLQSIHNKNGAQRCMLRIVHLSEMVSDEIVKSICTICPGITDIQIIGSITNEAVLCLSCLQFLTVLDLGIADGNSVQFEPSVSQLLRICGRSLLKLLLHDIVGIDLKTVAACCPVLQHLEVTLDRPQVRTLSHAVDDSLDVAEDYSKHFKPFSKLIDVELHNFQPAVIFDDDTITFLLSHARKLRRLHLKNVDSFTDQVLADVLAANTMDNIADVHLNCCHRITGSAILAMLKLPNCLKSLDLINCQQVTLSDSIQFMNLAQRNNYELSVKWT